MQNSCVAHRPRSGSLSRFGLAALLGAGALVLTPRLARADGQRGSAVETDDGDTPRAGQRHARRGGHKGYRKGKAGPLLRLPMAKLERRLGLTPAQVRSLGTLRKQYKVAVQPLRALSRQYRAALAAEHEKAQPSVIRIAALERELKNVRLQKKQLTKRAKKQAFALLTPDQRAKVKAMQGKHRRAGRARA